MDLSDLTTRLLSLFEPFEVERVNLGIFLLHPDLAGLAYQQERGADDVVEVRVSREALRHPIYLQSPIYNCLQSGEDRVWDLAEVRDDLPFLDELRQQGYRGYAVLLLPGMQGRVHVLSVATRGEGGVTPALLEKLQITKLTLGMVIDALASRTLAEHLLQIYLGTLSGTRVLEGQVLRGEGTLIEGAILFCDLRDFTRLCHLLGEVPTIRFLNEYMEQVCRPIESNGGEILKFIGDSVVAIFPIGAGGAVASCEAALSSALEGRERLRYWDWRHPVTNAPVQAGWALHLGRFHYGNIGINSRLDFTAIGDSINLTARLEQLCGELREDVLMSELFANTLGQASRRVGTYRLKGLSEPVEVFAHEEHAAAALSG